MRSDRERRNGRPRSLATLTAKRYWRTVEAEQVVAAWRRSGTALSLIHFTLSNVLFALSAPALSR